MAYQIQYGRAMPDRYHKTEHGKGWKWSIAFLLVCIIGIRLAFPQIGTQVRGFLLPGFDERAESAFSTMVTSLQSGEPVQEAVTTFCQEIIQNGKSE